MTAKIVKVTITVEGLTENDKPVLLQDKFLWRKEDTYMSVDTPVQTMGFHLVDRIVQQIRKRELQ